MPVKRDGWFQPTRLTTGRGEYLFQCPLSGLVGCNMLRFPKPSVVTRFQCPLSGLVGCNTRPCADLETAVCFNAL